MAVNGYSDSGLIFLGNLNLRKLYLSETQVSDAGVANLRFLMDLQTLWLEGTQVTAAGVSALKILLPNCQIILNSGFGISPPTEPAK